MGKTPEEWMRLAIELAVENVRRESGGPFAALVVSGGRLVGEGKNSVTASNDPTAHAEVEAIRAACRQLGTFQLTGCELYTSCEPCPMCLGAIYWARLDRFYFAARREDAMAHGFDDAFIYDELSRQPEERAVSGYGLLAEEGLAPFQEWGRSATKIPY
jgi:guanine deaminase